MFDTCTNAQGEKNKKKTIFLIFFKYIYYVHKQFQGCMFAVFKLLLRVLKIFMFLLTDYLCLCLLFIYSFQVHIWRRSFNVPPPEMKPDHDYFEKVNKDVRYKDVPVKEMPTAESLELTIKRTLPFWNDEIVPSIKAGKKIIIAAHGNSLRGIVKHLDSK